MFNKIIELEEIVIKSEDVIWKAQLALKSTCAEFQVE